MRSEVLLTICFLGIFFSTSGQSKVQSQKPNIVLILCDQYRADASKREGFGLDTTPFLDSLAQSGTWFNRAYCSAPACVPSRTSLMSGRFPSSTKVKSNHNIQDAVYTEDIIDVVKAKGYKVGLVGKTGHSFIKFSPERYDFFKPFGHLDEPNNKDPKVLAFNKYLHGTNFYADFDPAPFPPEMEQPYRIVSYGLDWIASIKDKENPFFLYLSIPEPHNPYQVPEPYYSLFPPDKLPPLVGKEALSAKGKKFLMQRQLEEIGYPGFEEHIPRIRSNYYGMMRLIDDQIKRLVKYFKVNGLYENTIFIFLADHGDLTGEYGLIKKGVGLPDCLARIPMIWHGPGILKNRQPHDAHVSNIDILPTICTIVDYPIPDGVIGRSLWPLLTGKNYPKSEFRSIIAQQGFGGRDYTSISQIDPYEDGCLKVGKTQFDELNSYSQSGILRMVRKGDYKLIYNMQGNGRLYNLVNDPAEIIDLYNKRGYEKIKMDLLEEMMGWELRSQDPLPLPRTRYIYRGDEYNYWTPYNDPDVM